MKFFHPSQWFGLLFYRVFECKLRNHRLTAQLLVAWTVGTALLVFAGCGINPESALPDEADPLSTGEQATALPRSTSGNSEGPKPTDTLEMIQVKWQESPHAATYVVMDSGQNNTCARCHAPASWMPSMDDMPESCYACKFEVKPPPSYIKESDWQHVACKVCHRVNKDKVDSEIAWLEIPPIEEYSQVETSTVLCQKCHTPLDVPGHSGMQVEGDHSGMACSECHDAHATTPAGCDSSGCHPEAANLEAGIPGHDLDHQAVSCSACHDAAGLAVGPDSQGNWVTYNPSPAGDGAQEAFTSHNIVLAAPCERCHYSGNPWQLSTVEAGQP